jgi:hypothetical protein
VEEKAIYGKIQYSFKKEEEYYKIKSKILWLQAGDKNASYFDKQSKARKQRNNVKDIKKENDEKTPIY